MKKHDCIKRFIEIQLEKSDTKHVITGYCTMCQRRMLKIFRYQGTYERDTMKKLDPKKEKN